VSQASSNKQRASAELGISRSSLYYEPKLPGKDDLLRTRIEEVMINHPGYGYRRLSICLGVNHKRVQRVMQKYGLKPVRRAKAPKKGGDIGRLESKHPDILSTCCPCVPNEVWQSDFTYIRFHGRFVYLATVLDGFTGEVLGSNVSTRHDANLVRRAIERAEVKEGRVPSWFHSDQGSEFDSHYVSDWLTTRGAKLSMSPKGSPWRNGAQESFFGRFKIEFGDFERFQSLDKLVEELYSHLHYFSAIRIKTRLKMSPQEFRQVWETRVGFAVLSTGYESPPQTPPPPGGPCSSDLLV
jgi:transposase InsO family protein